MAPRSSTRQAARQPAIPFPDLPERSAPDTLVWRALWLRAASQHAAVEQLMNRIWTQKATTAPLRHALAGLWQSLGEEAKSNFDNLVTSGGLLYAWIPEGGAA